VKLRPKIRSSGGSRAFGELVLVMLSFVGSMSWILLPTEASAWMLYGRCVCVRHRNEALSGAAGERKAQLESDESSRDDRCCNMVTGGL
jgi:hypothetical protein